jgi:hypothetical protein
MLQTCHTLGRSSISCHSCNIINYFLSSDRFHNSYQLSDSYKWLQTVVSQPSEIRPFLYQSMKLTVPGDLGTIKIRDSIKTPDAHGISVCIDRISHRDPYNIGVKYK